MIKFLAIWLICWPIHLGVSIIKCTYMEIKRRKQQDLNTGIQPFGLERLEIAAQYFFANEKLGEEDRTTKIDWTKNGF